MPNSESGGAGEYAIVTGTAGSREEAEKLAGLLVEQRLAACVQVEPVHSLYRWGGAVERADEYRFSAKTRRSLAPLAIAAVKASHSYDVPEIVVIPIVDGHGDYLAWIEAETVDR